MVWVLVTTKHKWIVINVTLKVEEFYLCQKFSRSLEDLTGNQKKF